MGGTRLYRSVNNRMIAGVAGGLAQYFNTDISLVRLLWVLSIFIGGGGVLAYIIAWIVIPEEPYYSNASNDGTTINATTVSSDGDSPQVYPTKNGTMDNRRFSYIGLFLVLMGVFFLLKEIFPWELSRYFWPFLLICLGVLLLLPRKGN